MFTDQVPRPSHIQRRKRPADIRKPSFATQSRPTKHNPNAYPILADENNGNYWIKRFRAIATSQGLSNVLDAAYKPRESQAITQFNEEQDFLFDVLCTTVTFPQGQAIVRRYERGRDAQGALEAIVNYFIALEKDLLDDICTIKLTDLPANVPLTGHLSVWVELVYKYNGNVLDPHGGMEDRDKKNYLQGFVKGSELEGVKVSKTYDDYVQDIFCAAMLLDDRNGDLANECFPDTNESGDAGKTVDDAITKNKSPTVDQTADTTAQLHDSHSRDQVAHSTPSSQGTASRIDTVVSTTESFEKMSLQASKKPPMDHTTEFRHDHAPFIGPNGYEELSKDDQMLWNYLSYEAKWIIYNEIDVDEELKHQGQAEGPTTPDRESLESIDIATPQSETAAAATTLATMGHGMSLDTPIAPVSHRITQGNSPNTSTESGNSTETEHDLTSMREPDQLAQEHNFPPAGTLTKQYSPTSWRKEETEGSRKEGQALRGTTQEQRP